MVIDNKQERTSVQVSIETRERLIKLGSKNESYEDIIKRLIDFYDKFDENSR